MTEPLRPTGPRPTPFIILNTISTTKGGCACVVGPPTLPDPARTDMQVLDPRGNTVSAPSPDPLVRTIAGSIIQILIT